MEAIWRWFDKEWFTLLQSIGIVGGLWIATATIRRDTRSRRVSDALALSQQHRDLWQDANRRQELQRIFFNEVDLVSKPSTIAEEEFLSLVIMHFQMAWLLAKEHRNNGLDALARDAKAFFSLPIPRRVWERTKGERLDKFVAFIDASL